METEFEQMKRQKEEMERRAKGRELNPLKLIVSGAERHVSEALRVGCGPGTEYALAAHKMLMRALEFIEKGKVTS